MKRLATAFLPWILAATAVAAASAPPAAADPLASKRAEAERIARELDQLSRQASMLTEQLNQARLKAERVEREAAEAAAAAVRAEQQTEAARLRLLRHAVDAYVDGGLVDGGVLDVEDATKLMVGQHYLAVIAKEKADAIDALREATRRHREMQAAADAAKLDARHAIDAVDARRSAAAQAVSAERRTLQQVQGELASLVEAERERRAAEEARKAQEALAARRAQEEAQRRNPATPPTRPPSGGGSGGPGSGGSGGPGPKPPAAQPPAPSSPPPPVASGASGAVEEAKKHVGKPYEYGGSGPDTFDCSGLTSWAWRYGGGKSLPHSSRAQYSATARITIDDVAPGDLLFYGPNVEGIHHVGIYVGGGQMVEAPETGKNVRYGSIYRRDLVGVGRVR